MNHAEIFEDELQHNRPMLTALVVGVSGKPGQGFYDLARDLGKLSEGADEIEFWQTEKSVVYKVWKREFK